MTSEFENSAIPIYSLASAIRLEKGWGEKQGITGLAGECDQIGDRRKKFLD